MEGKKAAAYIRVSTEEQVEYSPASQLKKIREYASKHGYFVPDNLVFADEGLSGKTTKKRTEFKKMISLAKTKPKPFDIILVWKFSRFARNREDSIVYKSMLRRDFGIRVISVSEDLGDDKMSVLFEAIIEAMDEYYSVNLAEEVKRGMTERIKQGGACAVAPFGYFMENKRLKICESEAEIIRWVFEASQNGESYVEIARKLNDMGVVTHRGNKIENRTVEYWLHNPVYVGKLRWNTDKKLSEKDIGKSIIIADGEHSAIVSDELWEAVQAKQKKYKKRNLYECKNLSSWLVGIFKCGVCGGAMVNCGGYFYCGNKIKGTCMGNGGVKAELLEREVLTEIENISYKPEFEFLSCSQNVTTINRIEAAKAKLQRVKLAYESGVDSLEEYRKNKCRVQNQIELLMQENHNGKNMNKPIELCIMDILKNSNVNVTEKSRAARTILEKVVKVGKDEYNVFLNF